MIVVLPAPVASFSASRISSGLASLLADARWSSRHLPFLNWGATSVSQNRGFHGLHPAEERTDTAEPVMAPVLKKTGCLRRYLPLIGIGQ
jgi:hypothetical protein